jgi:hypothetical protein
MLERNRTLTRLDLRESGINAEGTATAVYCMCVAFLAVACCVCMLLFLLGMRVLSCLCVRSIGFGGPLCKPLSAHFRGGGGEGGRNSVSGRISVSQL